MAETFKCFTDEKHLDLLIETRVYHKYVKNTNNVERPFLCGNYVLVDRLKIETKEEDKKIL